MSTIATLGESFPDLIFEAVADPNGHGDLQLQSWNGRRGTTASELQHGGSSYVPMKLPSELLRLVRFAPPSLPFDSPSQLVSALRDFFSRYVRPQPEVVALLTAFVFASWFCDFMTMAPVLYLFGRDDVISKVLWLLSFVCRRAVLLGDIDVAGLATFPRGLSPTLLLNQRDLERRVRRALLASTRRDFCVVRGNRRLDLYGARAFSCENVALDEPGLRVCLSPAQDPLPVLTDAEELAMARDFQSRLLRYRMMHYRSVREAKVDCRVFVPEMRQQAWSWLAPIEDCPELSEPVFAEILRQSKEAAGARLVDPKCLVAEAALFFCHKKDATHFFVGELTEKVNLLLEGRHEKPTFSAKGVGVILRELGLHGGRVAEGYRITLTDATRQYIHRLAHDYQVPALQDGVRRCQFCPEDRTVSKPVLSG